MRAKGKFRSYKNFGPERGWSCCFRQWKATHSHCSLLHGYALGVKMEFEAETLDDRNWVMDFGGFGAIKEYLENLLDHSLLVAKDDPKLIDLVNLGGMGLARVVVLPAVGCEALSFLIFNHVESWLVQTCNRRVKLLKVEVYEHGSNGASFVIENEAGDVG